MLMPVDSELGESGLSLDILDATIISSNFWPPIQVIQFVLSIICMKFYFGEMIIKHIDMSKHLLTRRHIFLHSYHC